MTVTGVRDPDAPRRDVVAGATDLAVRRQWDDVLRSYADALDQHRALLLGVHPEGFESDLATVAFVPPDGLPPCPAEMAPRLRALELETAGLVELARSTLAELKPSAPPHVHRAPAADATSNRMDTRL